MYKSIGFFAAFNERTGYGIHATNLCRELEKLIPVKRNEAGDVNISLIDSVSIQNVTERLPYPSFVMNAWESTLQPDWFIEKLKFFDGLIVVSEWQRACSIAQGVPEEFVITIPEGVNPDVFYPVHVIDPSETFDFLVVGQFQRRKSTLEIIQSFLKAFPNNNRVRLYLSVDTLFPSDEYKTTEERLAGNGIFDERIIPVHFETQAAYVRRLQTCNVYAQCSRSEGFGLPGIEAMACGAVSIMEGWGGSTEYSDGALHVRVPKLEKPEGIYGNWEVPGMWGSPDYEHLVDVMRDAYDNYDKHKAKALITSTTIRTKFSWEAAAKKAYDVLEELSQKPEQIPATICETPLDLEALRSRNVLFSVDCHPTSQAKIDCLVETVTQVKEYGYPVLIVSHCSLPASVIELADYYIYDKNDILSGDDLPVYFRTGADGTIETTKSSIPCHALAGLHNVRHATDFAIQNQFEWLYHMNSDCEVDMDKWMSMVLASDKPLLACTWDNDPHTFGGQITAGKVEYMDKIYPRLKTWAEFAELFGDSRFRSEGEWYNIVDRAVGIENVEFLDITLGNRFDQVDRDAWADDIFQCNFIDGPYLVINGISNREYDVRYSNPIDGNNYTVRQKTGMWSKPATKYFREWTMKAYLEGEEKFSHTLDLAGKNVIISMGSKALGDTIAWMPYVEEFRKKHGCIVHCSTWWNAIMDYPEINFIMPGDVVDDVYASYEVGCFDDNPAKNPTNWRTVPLQKVSADILGLDYKPMRTRLKYEQHKPKGNGNPPKPYVCFSEFSTMQAKLWNREGAWQKIIDYLNGLGYDCISISAERSPLERVIRHNGQSIEQTLTDISGCEFYIGLNAGPTWLATAIGKPVIMLTGLSEEWNDFPNPYRVSVDTGCKPCFNNTDIPIDRDFSWCTNEDKFVCTKAITEDMVKDTIDCIRKEIGYAVDERKERQDSIGEHIGTRSFGEAATPSSGDSNEQGRTIPAQA